VFSLANKVALVTGAGSGIGQRQAIALAQAGATVVLTGRRQSALETTATHIKSLDAKTPEPIIQVGDLAGPTQCPEFAAKVLARVPRIDILCNTAGVNLREPWQDITPESWSQTLDLNLAVPFFLAREFVPSMIDQGWGRIINIASLQTTRAFTNGLAYGASKGGIGQVTRAMAEAWSENGITANAIAPGFFPTGLTAPVFNDTKATDSLAARTAMKRNGKLEDLDGITVFLASHASDYITGQIVGVDGGFTAL